MEYMFKRGGLPGMSLKANKRFFARSMEFHVAVVTAVTNVDANSVQKLPEREV
jgi:hypothetical protein